MTMSSIIIESVFQRFFCTIGCRTAVFLTVFCPACLSCCFYQMRHFEYDILRGIRIIACESGDFIPVVSMSVCGLRIPMICQYLRKRYRDTSCCIVILRFIGEIVVVTHAIKRFSLSPLRLNIRADLFLANQFSVLLYRVWRIRKTVRIIFYQFYRPECSSQRAVRPDAPEFVFFIFVQIRLGKIGFFSVVFRRGVNAAVYQREHGLQSRIGGQDRITLIVIEIHYI